jgi:hypothetical protein
MGGVQLEQVDVAECLSLEVFLTHGGGVAVAVRTARSERLLLRSPRLAEGPGCVVQLAVFAAKQHGDAMRAKTWRNKVKQGGRSGDIPVGGNYAFE